MLDFEIMRINCNLEIIKLNQIESCMNSIHFIATAKR